MDDLSRKLRNKNLAERNRESIYFLVGIFTGVH